MRAKNENDHGRHAMAILATTYVLAAGLGVCSLILVTSADNAQVTRLLMFCIGTVVLVWVLAWMLRDRRTNSSAITNVVWLAYRRRNRTPVVYRPVSRRESAPIPLGGNTPPTVERLREISENVKTWVPSQSRSDKHRKSAETE